MCEMIAIIVVIAALAVCTEAFNVQTGMRASMRSLKMEDGEPPKDGPEYKKTQMSLTIKKSKNTGAGFNYDPSNYKDSANEGNYRRLSDQQAAIKAEDDKLAREREEIIRQEKMKKMLLKQENATFWETPGDKVVATSEKFFVPPSVIQVIDDLDNEVRAFLAFFVLHVRLFSTAGILASCTNVLPTLISLFGFFNWTACHSQHFHPEIIAYRSQAREGQDA